jgi:hypothetical protein
MVCCKKAEVGKAELAMGLQSGMAASQTWIRERAASGIPWNEASASTTAAASSSRVVAAGSPGSAGAGAVRRVVGDVVGRCRLALSNPH